MSVPDSVSPASATVVFVHGAFADSSGWNGVIERLTAAGVQVRAVANPLRGISIDSAYVASALAQVPGPVLAVGHSYGGAGLPNAPAEPRNRLRPVHRCALSPPAGGRLRDNAKGATPTRLE